MATEQNNKEILSEAYQLWHETKGGSVQHWLDISSENISFGSLAQGAAPVRFTAPRNNKNEMHGYLRDLTNEWEMIHYTVDHYIAEGDFVIAVGSTAWTNKATGKIADTRKVDVTRFRDGKMVEFFEYYDTAALIDAAS
ncbi:nuclear transport factor 2 family protein [Ruegeria atlantica]|uniref:nuclear transport factor 2 family protein n=1 Tax=Ruegeria atlantica TaxID=81569 RepID=UPI0014802B63|nr:nuclear transport factor 2 family protein [Ruegeria atlantica]